MALSIRRLEEADSLDAFDCGDDALNNYLRRHAWNNQLKSSIGVTYVAADESAPRTVLGYFTLAASGVARESLPAKYVRGLPPYDLPMILLARLAVDRRFSGRGLGRTLLAEALKISAGISEQIGCRAVVVDAYPAAVPWYGVYGFIPIEGGKGPNVRMYLDIRTIRAAR